MGSDFTVIINEYMPLRELVFTTLRQAILKGELQPGERLMEIQLAEKMGVSRTPIREAIRKLAGEGLVNMIPRKGAVVAGISKKMLTDVLQVRMTLEKMAYTCALENNCPELIEDLKRVEECFEAAIAAGNTLELTEYDEKFHFVIFKAAGNEKLTEIITALKENIYRYRMEYSKDTNCWQMLIKEHNEIIRSFELNDAEYGMDAVIRHIENQQNAIISMIEKEEAEKEKSRR